MIAQAALSPQALAIKDDHINQIKRQRERLIHEIKSIKRLGQILGRNDANFVLVQVLDEFNSPSNDTALFVYKTLANEMDIVVRFRGNELGCTGCLRITIGTPQENTLLIEKLRILLNK